MLENEDHFKNFLLNDFAQQYEEYRQAEASRIRYVQFFVSLVIAVLAFFGALYRAVGFPAPTIDPVIVLLSLSMVLFFIGCGVVNICISTRVSQMQTAKYLNDVKTHFFKLEKVNELEASRKRIYFAEKDWASEKMPFLQEMRIFSFMLSVLVALMMFSLSKIIFWFLETKIMRYFEDLEFVLNIWNFLGDQLKLRSKYVMSCNVISVVVGIISLIIAYKIIKCKISNDLRKIQEEVN